MLVKENMSHNVVFVDENTSIIKAAELMKEKKVRRFPVLRNGSIVGIVTDRDLRSAAPSQVISFDENERKLMPSLYSLLSQVAVKTIMSRNVITVGPEKSIMAAAEMMLKYRISGIPVISSTGEIVGIITQTDIFTRLVDLSGAYYGGTLLAFDLENRSGSTKEVTDIIRKYGGRIISILGSDSEISEQTRRVHIRATGLKDEMLENLKRDLERKTTVVYIVTEPCVEK